MGSAAPAKASKEPAQSPSVSNIRGIESRPARFRTRRLRRHVECPRREQLRRAVTSIVQAVGSNSFLASELDEALEIKRPATFGADSVAYSRSPFETMAVQSLVLRTESARQRALNGAPPLLAIADHRADMPGRSIRFCP